jgi:hypothetical protein
MQLASFSKRFAGALAAVALCTSSTGAIAASTQAAHPVSISPLVALSALGSDASRAALCGASAAAVAGAAAASAQGAAQGCVLPVVDAAPPPPVAETLPPPPVAPPPVAPVGGGFGFSPRLLALAGIGAAVLLVVLLHKKNDNDESPA